MGNVVNLNRVRKARERQEAKTTAAENRARFGQDKATRDKGRREVERARRDLEGKKLD